MSRAVLVMLAAALAGCVGGPPVATPADAARANVQLADLEQGRTLMLGKCGGCHVAPMPAKHAPGDWPRSLDQMTDRSKLDATQRRLIEAYLVTMSSAPAAP
jgi:hypothetical protein